MTRLVPRRAPRGRSTDVDGSGVWGNYWLVWELGPSLVVRSRPRPTRLPIRNYRTPIRRGLFWEMHCGLKGRCALRRLRNVRDFQTTAQRAPPAKIGRRRSYETEHPHPHNLQSRHRVRSVLTSLLRHSSAWARNGALAGEKQA